MCGRYTQTATPAELQARFGLRPPGFPVPPRYNLAPTQEGPVVVEDSGRELRMMRWGLVPSWAKDPSIGPKLINARAEAAGEKPSFRRSLERRRCLVPADGWFEWVSPANAKTKTPYRITLKGRGVFAFAGLWDEWISPQREVLRSYAILTVDALPSLNHLHHRMPLVLRPEDEALWLAPDLPPAGAAALLTQHDLPFHAYTVSTAVGSPKNDTPDLLEPAP